jgi:hypothetical protein
MSQFSSTSSGLQQCQSSADHPPTALLLVVLSKLGQVPITLMGSPVLVTTRVVLTPLPLNYIPGLIVMITIRTLSTMLALPTSLPCTAALPVVSSHAYVPRSSCLDSSPVVSSHSLIDGNHQARSSRPLLLTLPHAVLLFWRRPPFAMRDRTS